MAGDFLAKGSSAFAPEPMSGLSHKGCVSQWEPSVLPDRCQYSNATCCAHGDDSESDPGERRVQNEGLKVKVTAASSEIKMIVLVCKDDATVKQSIWLPGGCVDSENNPSGRFD